MALMTTAEVKAILRLTDSTYDGDIETFLPYVEDDIIEYLNNAFQDGYVYRESAGALAFAPDTSTGDYITDEESKFGERGFTADMDIVIEGGWSNVGLYHVAAATDSQLTLSEKGELIAQDQNDTTDDHNIGSVRISRVKWPNAIKLAAAKMVWHLIDEPTPGDVQSESLGDYSVTYVGMHAYPRRVAKMLEPWRRPAFR
jgi:hypothetical protein